MKRFISVLLIFLTVLPALAGCGSGNDEKNTKTDNKTEALSDAGSETDNGTGSMTLMVYMIGSDLESKSGAGTSDLEEMAGSGMDTSASNLIVCAGGAPVWHNEEITSDSLSVLKLNNDKFETVYKKDPASMGEPQTLADFLNYCYENYKTDNYALILWDHGSGPVIGYGKDMLFGKESLTLSEMKQALEKTPFSKDKKLLWAGFDACLMASAELSCVFADHAQYLIASQEVEPAFGWQYDFLADIGKESTKSVISKILESYLKNCEAYYEKRGFENRDTTLSCIDLTYADGLKTAVNGLFAKALSDMPGSYNMLAKARADARSLGRASTGSDYDLVDLRDLAEQYGEIYKSESEKICEVLDKMTVQNSTNAEKCCGMSLFYPFYNKYYYEKDWANVYKELDLFESYSEYLGKYETVWLKGEEELQSYASSILPQTAGKGVYTYKLTDEQAERYADARYYILKKEGGETYTTVYTSRDVTYDNGTLTANFDGKVLYVKNNTGTMFMPVVTERDKVGDISRYSVYLWLQNGTALDVKDEQNCYYHIGLNKKAGKITVSALVPSDSEISTADLADGKLEDLELSDWTVANFPDNRHIILKRSDSGYVMPLNTWDKTDVFTGKSLNTADGISFVYDSISGGEYVIVFEIKDTQGNKYCSELLDVETADVEAPEKENLEYDVKWDNGERVRLFSIDGVTAYLKKQEEQKYYLSTYVIEIENETDGEIKFDARYLIADQKIYCADSAAYFNIPAHSTAESRALDFGDALSCGALGKLKYIDFGCRTTDVQTGKTIFTNCFVEVELSEETSIDLSVDAVKAKERTKRTYDDITEPFRGVYTSDKVIYDKDGVKITLVRFGAYDGKEDSNGIGYLKIENSTEKAVYIYRDTVALSGISLDCASSVTAYGMLTTYKYLSIDSYDADKAGVHSADSMTVQLRFTETDMLGFQGHGENVFCNVLLDVKGSGDTFEEGKETVYNDHGIRIAFKEYDEKTGRWYYTVVNDSDEDISVDIGTLKQDGADVTGSSKSSLFITDSKVAAHQKAAMYFFKGSLTGSPFNEAEATLTIRSYNGDKTLYTSDRIIRFK